MYGLSGHRRNCFSCGIVLFLLFFFSLSANAVPLGWVGMVDNADPGYAETGMSWVSYDWSSSINGQYRYLSHLGHTVERKGTATWQLSIPTSGTYRVDIHYRPTDNRTVDADFNVYDGKGIIHHHSIDQTYNGPLSSIGWLTLGKYDWSAGQTAKIVLDGTDDDLSDEADAVRFVLVKMGAATGSRVPLSLVQGLLLDGNQLPAAVPTQVNLEGVWSETGGYEGCPQNTALATLISYTDGRYQLHKYGVVEGPDCSLVQLLDYSRTLSPTDKLVTSTMFSAMMEETFTEATSIDIVDFLPTTILFHVYYPSGARQVRLMEKQ